MTSLIYYDDDGEYLKFYFDSLQNKYCYIFERNIVFRNKNERDIYYNEYMKLLPNYLVTCKKFDLSNSFLIIIKYYFRPNDFFQKKVYQDDNNIFFYKIYLMEKKHNIHLEKIYDDFRKLIANGISKNTYVEKYKLFNETMSQILIFFKDPLNQPKFIT